MRRKLFDKQSLESAVVRRRAPRLACNPLDLDQLVRLHNVKLRQVLIKSQRKRIRGPPNHAVRRRVTACLLLIVCAVRDGLHQDLDLLELHRAPPPQSCQTARRRRLHRADAALRKGVTVGCVGRRSQIRHLEAVAEADEEIRHKLATYVVSAALGAAPAPKPARLEGEVSVRLGLSDEDNFDPARTDVDDDEPPQGTEPEEIHPYLCAGSNRFQLEPREPVPVKVFR